jgi:hypothetical protein
MRIMLHLLAFIAAFVVSLLWIVPARAQTSGSVNVPSLRIPIPAPLVSARVQTETLGAANSGQLANLGAVDLIKSSTLLAEIPGPKTAGAKTTVSSVRVTLTLTGLTGVRIDPVVIHIDLPGVILPQGQTLAVRYDMPLAQAGTFQWLVGAGAKASSIPPPVVGPVAGGTITPAPAPVPAPVVTPPAACTPDAVGTKSPPAAQLIASDCSKWVLSGTTVTRDGVDTKNEFTNPGQTDHIQVGPLGPIRVYRPDGVWNCWNNGWVGDGC